MKYVEEVAQLVKNANRIVAFTGAGISTESGIPDFRSAGGVFDQLTNRHFTGEEALSVPFFESYPALFYENYRKTLDFPDAKPNFGHQFFRLLEEQGKDVTIVTQNIDNLHEATGNKNVLTLHGNATQWRTAKKRKPVAKEAVTWNEKGIAVDDKGQLLRPDIVMYGDQLDQQTMHEAVRAIQSADLMFVIGTSLNVMPASFFVDEFQGEHAVLINQTKVDRMDRFDIIVTEKSGLFLEKVWERLSEEN